MIGIEVNPSMLSNTCFIYTGKIAIIGPVSHSHLNYQ